MWISQAFAQSEELTDATIAVAEAPSAGEAFMMNMLLIGVLVALFYFLMIRPQQKRMKTHQNMLSQLDKGAKIVTQGGLVGTVDKILNDNEMLIQVGDVKITILRSAVMSMYQDAMPANDTADNKKKTEKAPSKKK